MKNKMKSEEGTSPLDRLQAIVNADAVASQAFAERSVVLSAARLIREMRMKANLTQEELAKRIGTYQPNIARAERGEGLRGSTMEMLSRVAVACGQQLIMGYTAQAGAAALVERAADLDGHLMAM